METINTCICCLQRPPDKDLSTPYTRFGIPEIYSEMIKECFEIQLKIDTDNECGICGGCVGRLQDASDFKLQVQRSQVVLQARLIENLYVKQENPDKLEMVDDESDGEYEKDSLTFGLHASTTESSWPETAPKKSEDFDCYVAKHLRDNPSQGVPKNEDTFDNETSLTLMTAHESIAVTPEINDDTFNVTEDKPYTCTICGELFPLKKTFTKHIKVHMQPSAVKIRSKKLCRKDFTQQPTTRTGEHYYTCDICQYMCAERRNLIRHLANHAERKPQVCHICNKIFRDENALKAHQRYHKGSFNCETCKQHFKSKAELRAHRHVKNDSYDCEVCGKQFKSKAYLKRHKRVHTVREPHTCKICHKQVMNIQVHAYIHKQKELYRCEFCDKAYVRLQSLNLHKQVHSSYSYCCETCGKQCMSKQLLNSHMLSHTGAKRFICDICQKRFTYKYDLKAHIAGHMGYKPYCCNICARKFPFASSLRRHMMIHRGDRAYACEICNKQFRTKDKLQRHNTIHTGEKPFLCGICGKSFALKYYLKTHQEIHVEGKTFSCDVCPKSYSTKGGLRQHIRVHTRDGGREGREKVARSGKSKKKNRPAALEDICGESSDETGFPKACLKLVM